MPGPTLRALVLAASTLGLAMPLGTWAAEPANRIIVLATGHTLRDSGLLDVLIPVFEKKTGYIVRPIAVGTGQALTMGKRGDADILLTHDPEAEAPLVKEAYPFTDRATFLNLQKTLGLEILLEGDPVLLNLYSVMEVNPAKRPKANHAGARAFSGFLISEEGRALIKDFGKDRFGQALYFLDPVK